MIWSISANSNPVIERSRPSATSSYVSSGKFTASTVPAGSLGQFVVRKHERAFLSRRKSLHSDGGNLFHAEQLCGQAARRPGGQAARRPCPARIVSVSSTTIGTQKPNALILDAICLTCFLGWTRALRGFSFKLFGTTCDVHRKVSDGVVTPAGALRR